METRPLSDALTEDTLATVPDYAQKHGLTPAEFMVQHLLAAGFDVLAVDWRGPVIPRVSP